MNNQDEELDVIDISWQLRTDYRDCTGVQGFNEFGDGVLAGDAGIFGGPAARQSSDFADGRGIPQADGQGRLIHCYNCGQSLLVEPDLRDVLNKGKVIAQCNCGCKNRLTFDRIVLRKKLFNIAKKNAERVFGEVKRKILWKIKRREFESFPGNMVSDYRRWFKIYWACCLIAEEYSLDKLIHKILDRKRRREQDRSNGR